MQIVVRKKQGEFQVLKLIRSRPGGSQFGIGNLFNEVGLAQSGLFCGRGLLLAFDVPNQESGFMGISGKYTKSFFVGDHFGEHNENNVLHGRGIYIYSDVSINIHYWNNGAPAPGNFIEINEDRNFRVGNRYLKAGEMRTRDTLYDIREKRLWC